MQLNGHEKLQKISTNIYYLCLEETHINMAITKIGGMLRKNKIKRIVFVSVDKLLRCIGLHYIQDELRKMMKLSNVEIENYVVVDNELIKIDKETISLSKNLKELAELKPKVGDKDE